MEGKRLEFARWGPPDGRFPGDARPASGEAATLVLLHEGVGSVSAWRDWPAELAERSGLGVLAYSRLGYGRSDPASLPRPLDYMQRDGLTSLPAVLDAAGVAEAVLLGHSDGGSIALVHAGTPQAKPRILGLALLAAHVFCEERSVEGIEQARRDFLEGKLRGPLSRHHDDVDGAFWGWNRAWLDPGFRRWNIESFLPGVEAPVLAVQGTGDQYGTLAQVEAIERGSGGPVERLVLEDCGHRPQKERRSQTTDAVVDFVARVVSKPGDR